jgi:hypothetical protein
MTEEAAARILELLGVQVDLLNGVSQRLSVLEEAIVIHGRLIMSMRRGIETELPSDIDAFLNDVLGDDGVNV